MIGIVIVCFIVLMGLYALSGNKVFASLVSFALLTVGFCFIIIIHVINSYPMAIDVYRGKTTLEITYKDGVPVDSVVVYKDSL
jgi:hypothetical protein